MKLDLARISQEADWHERLPRYLLVRSLVKGKRVLDLGCGLGAGSALLADAGAAQVVGLDTSAEAIDSARQHLSHVASLRFVQREFEAPLLLSEKHLALQADGEGFSSAPTMQHARVSLDAPSASLEDVADDITNFAEMPAGPATGLFPRVEDPENDPNAHFDVILALNSVLPLSSELLWTHIGQALAEGGVVVSVARAPGHCGFWDVAQTIYGGGPDFPTSAVLRSRIEESLPSSSVYELAQESNLSVVFESKEYGELVMDAPRNEGLHVSAEGAEIEEPPNLRVLFATTQENFEPPSLNVGLPQAVLLEQLLEGVLRQVRRLEGLEHQTLVIESQLSQKEQLIDDLDLEVRETTRRWRGAQEQVEHLRDELDRLQGELTQREVIEGEEVLAQLRSERDRLSRELEWHLGEAHLALAERDNIIEQLRAQLSHHEEHTEQLRAALDNHQHQIEMLTRQQAQQERSFQRSRQGVLPFDGSAGVIAPAISGIPDNVGIPWVGDLEPVSLRAEDLLAEALRELAYVNRAWRETREQLTLQGRQRMVLEEEATRLRQDVERKQLATDGLHERLNESEGALKALGEELGTACYEAATRAELLQESLGEEKALSAGLSEKASSLAQTLTQEKQERERLETALEASRKTASEAQSKREREVASLRTELDRARSDSRALEKEKRELVNAVTKSKARALALESHIEGRENRVAELKGRVSELEKEAAAASIAGASVDDSREAEVPPADAPPQATSAEAIDERLEIAQREIEQRQARIETLEALVERWRTMAQPRPVETAPETPPKDAPVVASEPETAAVETLAESTEEDVPAPSSVEVSPAPPEVVEAAAEPDEQAPPSNDEQESHGDDQAAAESVPASDGEERPVEDEPGESEEPDNSELPDGVEASDEPDSDDDDSASPGGEGTSDDSDDSGSDDEESDDSPSSDDSDDEESDESDDDDESDDEDSDDEDSDDEDSDDDDESSDSDEESDDDDDGSSDSPEEEEPSDD